MKKAGLIISIFFSSILLKAQTGVGEDFQTGTVIPSAWASNSQYTLTLSPSQTPPTDPGINKEAYVTYTRAGESYSGITYTFSPINMEDAPYVSVKILTGKAFSLRIDLIDVNGLRTNQISTKQNIIASSGQYKDYLFDFTGRFIQGYSSTGAVTNDPVLATQIRQIEIIVNDGTSNTTGTFLLDSVMIGTRAKANIASGAKGIKLNQLGFFKDGPKKAVVNGGTAGNFYVVTNNLADTVYTGTLSTAKSWSPNSTESVRIADFTNFKTLGKYRIRVPGVPSPSYPFTISATPLNEISKASIKGFYYQRASTALPATYALAWFRAGGHQDNQVLIHNSAASPGRAAGSKISSPKGWYDAGDYNKYIVNSGISTYTLLASYEHFGTYYDTLKLNIPESSNLIPDILDEALYNVRWMLTMQDPYDGGVYHKLTDPNFDGDILMPSAATQLRYVVQKSTGATLDFAAVMAQSARIYSQYSSQLPGLADSCLIAATKAYDWAVLNPNLFYVQSQLTSPIIRTGTYDDWSFDDERSWAAAELFTTTQLSKYYDAINLNANAGIPSWQNVYTLGLISLAHNRIVLGDNSDSTRIKNKIIAVANTYRDGMTTSAYGTAMGTNGGFGWGSNSNATNQSMILIQAFNYTKDSTYLKAAVSNVDYILGRNGVNYCFVTGFGSLSSNKPHHRLSQSDGVIPAVPGLLVGGPNSSAPTQDKCPGYPSTEPAMSYVDSECSYASNEIAINWNAPLAYITGAIQSIYSGIKPTTRDYTVDVPTSTKSAVLKNITIKVYPNPTSSLLNVEKPFDLVSVPVVVDLNGVEYTISGDWSGNTIQINTAELEAGLYLIRLQGENGAAVQKFTVIK